MITDIDIFEAATNHGCIVGRAEFDAWMKAHDAEVRMDAIIARDTRTPAELIQAAWDAAYPVPEGRTIPGGTPNVMKYKDGTIMWNVMGSTYEIEFIETDRIRTLEPLPPVIPDDCEWVLAGCARLGDERCYWRRDRGRRYPWRTINAEGWSCGAKTAELIDPKPVPGGGS